MREWEQFFPEDERKMYEKAGYKGKYSFGRNPALLSSTSSPASPVLSRCRSWMPSTNFPPAAVSSVGRAAKDQRIARRLSRRQTFQ